MPIAIVQTKNGSGSGHKTVTLAAAPTVGNLIVVIYGCHSASALPNGAKYGTVNQSNGAGDGFAMIYRYVQAGDTAVLPDFSTNTTTFWSGTAWEISGVTGNPAVDFKQNFSSFSLTQSLTTINDGSIVLGGLQEYNSALSVTSSDLTTDLLYTGTSQIYTGHYLGGTAGTNVQFTCAEGSGSFKHHNSGILELGGTTPVAVGGAVGNSIIL